MKPAILAPSMVLVFLAVLPAAAAPVPELPQSSSLMHRSAPAGYDSADAIPAAELTGLGGTHLGARYGDGKGGTYAVGEDYHENGYHEN